MKQYKRLSKYLRGTSLAIKTLADEIDADADLTKESQTLLARIGAEMLFHAKSFTFLKEDTQKQPYKP